VGELVDEVEHAILPPFVRAILDEVMDQAWLRRSARRRIQDPFATRA